MRTLLMRGPRGLELRCSVPERMRERARGLLGRTDLDVHEALLIPNATSVHTFGMRFPILVARLDASLRVAEVGRVPPRRFVPPMRGARHVLECSPEADVRVGDRLEAVVQAGQPPRPAAPVTTQDPA